MGRIDQALRRAGTDGAAKLEPATGADTAASPWSFGDAPAAAPAAEPTPVKLRPATATPSPMIGHEPESGIAGFSPNWRDKLVTTPGADFKLVEQFRRLAAAMYQAQTSGRLKVVMVTS